MNKDEIVATNLRSISIEKLILGKDRKKYCFIIPSYQRGYRWDADQVVKLLDDLNEYKAAKDSNDTTIGDFYCLQPIVVKSLTEDKVKERMGVTYAYDINVNYYEIVDGQQRLTTIYILLKYLQDKRPQFFLIEYERDAQCGYSRKNILDHLCDENLPLPNNVDEYYFIDAYKAIEKWFDVKLQDDTDFDNAMSTLLKKHTRVIWYELDEAISDCYEVFRNINNGKIPLTDAELVKAMLLNSKLFAPQTSGNTNADREIKNAIIRRNQERYARLWDDIQHRLNDNHLWSFITGNHDFRTPTRIDFLLQLVVMKNSGTMFADAGKLFEYYENELGKLKNVDDGRETVVKEREYAESVFESVRKSFRTIQDWYETPKYFNYIGMIMTYTKKSKASEDDNRQERLKTLVNLMEFYDGHTRDEFLVELMRRVRKLIGKVTSDFMGLNDDSSIAPNDETDEDDFVGGDEGDDDDEENDVVNAQTASDKDIDDRSAVNYTHNRKDIEKWLMLFNILELNEVGEKFDFTIGESGWSVEHIKAQHSEVAKSEDWKGFLKKERERIGDGFDAIRQEIDAVLAMDNQYKEPLEEVMNKIDKEVDGFKDIDKHRLGNLALLSKDANSSFNNSQFYEKREKMLKNVDGNFPYSTRRVFLKVYCDQTYDLDYSKWGKEDFNKYLARQHAVLKAFIEELQKERAND